MPTKYYALLFVAGESKEVHVFDLPNFGEPNFYRHNLTFSGFRNRENKRLYEQQQKKKPVLAKRCSVIEAGDWSSLEKAYSELPHYTHPDIFEFYRAVGYSYSRKRYFDSPFPVHKQRQD